MNRLMLPTAPSEEPTAKFRCPRCGSRKFGTSFLPPPTTTHCHGDAGCRFSFPDPDRWRYFELRGEPFASPAQYDAHLARWRAWQNGTD